MTIWKFPIIITDAVAVKMPAGAQVLSVQVQKEVVCLWAIVNPDNPMEDRRFRIYGTGNPCFSPANRFVGTFQIYGGELVFHLFEDRP